MRLSSIFTVLLALAALILSLLCLFAGSTKSFIQNGDLLTLNVSRIGQGSAFNTSDGDGGVFDTFVNDIQGDLNDIISDTADKVADALNLTDFYAVHIMNYCDGFFEPNATVKNSHRNTTFCSKKQALFHFNPTKIIQDSLPSGVTLDDLHWPQGIKDATNAIRAAAIVMFVFYVIGIAFAGLAVIGGILTVFADGRLSAFANFLLDILAFLALGIASAVATAIITKAVNAVNKYGDDIGIAATKGTKFLGMTWGATAAMLLASILSVAQCVAGQKQRRDRHSEKPY